MATKNKGKAASKTGEKKTSAPIAPRTEAKTQLLRERAMLVRFSVGRWYGTGADEAVVSDLRTKHEATGDIGTFTKRFMSRHRLAAINQVTNDSRRFHKAMTLPWGDSGSRLLSADLFFDYKREMTAYEMKFNESVEEFLANYPKYIKAEKERLGTLFKDSDYPSVDDLRKRFTYSLVIDPIPSAEDFRVDLGEEEMKRIRAEIEQHVDASLKEASQELWSRLQEMIEKIKERLDGDSSIRKAMFEHLGDLVAVLPKLNVSNDPNLRSIAERISKELLSESVEAMRDDEHVRKETSKKADKILDVMATFSGKKKAVPEKASK